METIKKTPDQDIFDKIFDLIQKRGYMAYVFNPPEETPYPFVKMGYVQILPRATKSYLLGTAVVTFDVWGNRNSRTRVSTIADDIIKQISMVRYTDSGLRLKLDLNQAFTEIMTDNSTAVELWRARVTLQIQFN